MAVIAVHAGQLEVGKDRREESLINRAREMDADAWDTIYTTHHEAIFRYCFHRVGERTVAEDVAADVFLEAVRGIARYQYRGVAFRAWLYRIAHNVVVDHLRKRGSAVPSVTVDDSDSGPATDDDFASLVLDQTTIRNALVELTDEQQQVIVLRFFEGLPLADVAQAMGKRTGAIKALQHRAIGRLRSIMEPEALQ